MPTPNYFVQQMFAKNHGDETVPLEISGLDKENQIYASAVKDNTAGEIILKTVNPGAAAVESKINLDGLAGIASTAKTVVLTGENLGDMNWPDSPGKISPRESVIHDAGKNFTFSAAPRSLTVLRLKLR